VHLALVRGALEPNDVPLVRVHVKDTLRDAVGIQHEQLGWPLRVAMQRIAKEGHGIVVILRPEETPRDLMDAVQAVGQDEVAGGTRQSGAKLKTYGIGAQILRDLGVSRMRVLSAPKQMHGLSGFDLEVVEYVAG
jgi:3,4-dihydroxy 2-butanone 4-phosphate synthase/GTP cyclohydrolase II